MSGEGGRRARREIDRGPRRLWVLLGLLVVLALVAGCGGGGATSRSGHPSGGSGRSPMPATGSVPDALPDGWTGGTVRAEDLPPEARSTLALIASGGPFPYSQDGGTFRNREGLLPRRPPGAYREYTVETPGSPDRGARRIVVGDGRDAYYTDDHYATFRAIIP